MTERVIEVREREALRQRKRRLAEKLIRIPACADSKRRKELEQDDVAWLRWYFGDDDGCEAPFTYAFTADQLEIIEAIRVAMLSGDDQTIADSRGGGKTTIAERVLLKHTLCGALDFSILLQATGGLAEKCLEDIRAQVQYNQRLCDDYPEVCIPVRDVIGAPQKAKSQIVSGDRWDTGEPYEMAQSEFTWSGQEIVFPRAPGSPSSGAIIGTRGLDAAVRGLKSRGKRPKLVIIDDPDTDDTIRSQDQAAKLEDRIDRAIGGLGGQKQRCGRVILCTIASRVSVAWTYCDREKKPSFKAKRFRFLITPPDRMDLWRQYIDLKKEDWREDTNKANEFYLENRNAMDAGAVVANPNRFIGTPDMNRRDFLASSALELSALQFYFNEWARKNEKYCQTELDNDPPEDEAFVESGIHPRMIQTQLSGLPRGVIPRGCTVLSHACDVGKTKGWHWVVRAFRPDGSGFVIDYGNPSLIGAKYGSEEGLERAIYNAVLRRMDEFKSAGYMTEDGEILQNTISIFDARWKSDTIYKAVVAAGVGVYALIGIGKSGGAVQGTFHDLVAPTQTKKKCGTTGAYLELHTGEDFGRLWVVHSDADRWKAREHEGWLTAKDKPGCLFIFGEEAGAKGRLSADERQHDDYANHICGEIEAEVEHRGFMVRKWIPKSKQNDYLDASAMTNVGAAMRGIRVVGESRQPRKPPNERPSAQQIKEMASRK